MKRTGYKIVFAIILIAFVGSYVSTTDWFKPEVQRETIVIAHRAGSGQWPQNSRTAVLNSIETSRSDSPDNRYQGIEVDIVLTRDNHPVLSHDPWVHMASCQKSSGEKLSEQILIKTLTLMELQTNYLCGGLPDEEFPEVIPKSETIATLEEVLAALQQAPDLALFLDVKIDRELTATPLEYAKAIGKRLEAADLSNQIYIEGPTAEAIKAYRSEIRTRFVPMLSYPPFSAGENPVVTIVKTRWLTKIKLKSPLEMAQAAQAEGIVSHTAAITWNAAKEAVDNGIAVVLFTPNTIEDLERYCRWPSDILITDYPKLGHCP